MIKCAHSRLTCFCVRAETVAPVSSLRNQVDVALILLLQPEFKRRDAVGNWTVCIPTQVLLEFMNTITWSRLKSPLPISAAAEIVRYYVESGAPIIHAKPSQMQTVLALLQSVTSRKNIFDAGLAATLRDNGVVGLYTVNVKDYMWFDFLKVTNPLQISFNEFPYKGSF